MTYEGPERRQGNSEIVTTLAVLVQKTETIDKTVNEIRSESRMNADKIIKLNGLKQSLDGHILQDRWMMGVIMSMIIGIFVKLFNL